MNVLVTGGRGMIGRAVTKRLLREGHAVLSADRSVPDDSSREPRESQVVVDVNDAGQVWPLLVGKDAVVHLAGIPQAGTLPDETVLKTNLIGTYHVLAAARANGVRTVVQASSATLLGFDGSSLPPARYLPVDENHPVTTANVYALSKALGESVAQHIADQSRSMRIWSMRLTLVLGPTNWDREGAPRLADPARGAAHLFAYVWVDDVAEAIFRCLLAERATGHQSLLVSGPDVLARESADHLRERFFPKVSWAGGRSFVCTDRARDLLRFAPSRSWRDGAGGDGAGR